MILDFYRAFEEKHRGPRECIKSRLQVYRQFIEPIKTLYSDLKAVDLGCGRGEWLEVLGEAGFYPHGVDVDDGMLADCKALGLSHAKEDAIKHLRSLPDESQVIVSGIHIAEHLPFNALQALVIEALRVLKPCGLLILETPNPENISVGTTNFYLDPSHERPLPPELLKFLTDYYCFARSKILRLNEAPKLSHSDQVQLYDVITGISPDYAVIAQKNGNDADLKAFDAPFSLEFGLTIGILAQRHDTKIEHKLIDISQRIDYSEKIVTMISESSKRMEILHQKNTELQVALAKSEQQALHLAEQLGEKKQTLKNLEVRAQGFEVSIQEAEARAHKLQTDLDAVHAANHHHWKLAEAREQQIQAIYRSYSWRITKPLRCRGIQTSKLRDQGLLARLKALLKTIAKFVRLRCIRFMNARPGLRRFCVSIARKLGVYVPLRAIYLRLSSQHDTVTVLDLGQMNTDGQGGIDVPFSPRETLMIDELLSRIHTELATAQKEGKQR